MTEVLQFVIGEATRFVSPPAIAVEWVMAALVLLAVVAVPRRAAAFLRGVRAGFHRVAASPRLAIAICAVLPVAIRLALLPVAPPPLPSVHDEFSHLLLADTLAHGRLTNPTQPMWKHFETIHVIQRPTYNSMYPPAQGAFLALGQALFGHPWFGVLIAMSLMGAAVCWMMQGWLPPAWALYGTLIVICKLAIGSLWIDSYIAAAVPSLGGALLAGALPRVRRPDSRMADSFWFGVGVVILMNSRPFEGAVLTCAGLIWLLPALRRRWGKTGYYLLRVTALPAVAIVSAGVAFTGYYCWRVTGSPVRMPYVVNRDTYGWPENLAILPAKVVKLEDPVLQEMYMKEVHHRDIYRSPDRFIDNLITRLYDNWAVLIGPLLTAPLLLIPTLFRDRRTRPLVLFLAAIAALNLLQMVLYPYHLAPVIAIVFALVAQGTRHIYAGVSRLRRSAGFVLAAALPVFLILTAAMKRDADALRLPLAYWDRAAEPHREARAEIQSWLEARARPQLVIVRYSAFHSPDQEWVYNEADVDRSKVVWAREIDPASDAALVRYFSGREAWLLEADRYPQHVIHYGIRPAPICAGEDEW